MNRSIPFSRRRFLAAGATALGFPTIVPSSVFGKAGRPAPSERITVGAIGWGTIAGDWTPSFLNNDKCQVVAVADPMKEYGHYGYDGKETGGREAGRKIIDAHYSQSANKPVKACAAYADFREMMDKEDLDAVQISTPDHWHAYLAIYAARKGKHIYGQKPLALNIAEGRRMADEVTKAGVTWQTGSQQRSDKNFRLACELVRNGRIGKLKHVNVWLPHGRREGPFEKTPVPAGLDWDMWQGQVAKTDYVKEKTHVTFRYFWEYSGGTTTDWGAHHNDIALWGTGFERSGPVSVQGQSLVPMIPGGFTAASEYAVAYTYANGVTQLTRSTHGNDWKGSVLDKTVQQHGVRFEGTGGWIFVTRGKIEASHGDLLTTPLPSSAKRLYASDNHMKNFFDCVRSRQQPICDVEIGHRSVTVCHLGVIAMRLGRALKWNPATEQFVGDTAANGWLAREQRKPWSYEMV